MRIISRDEIIKRIAQGDAIVIYDNYVLRLNKWIKYHPGGDKAIHHMIGRDATDEMNAYHSDDTIKTFLKWKIGMVEGEWENMLPPIQGGEYITTETPKPCGQMCGEPAGHVTPKFGRETVVDPAEQYDDKLVEQDIDTLPSLDIKTQQKISDEYNALHQKIIAAGFYSCDYWRYVKELLRIGALFCSSMFCLRKNWQFASAVFLGMAWQQLVFIAHDAGHIGITHHYQLDNIFGMTIASWCGGLSLGWWKRNHNVHHLVTNDPVHDPDIQHLPFFAVSTRLFRNIYSTYYEKILWFDAVARKMVPIQHFLYYPILCFGRFNLYRLSWQHVLLGQGPRHGKAAWFRYYELAGLTFFNWWFFYLVVGSLPTWRERIVYILVSHIVTMIVHVQITLSHFAMSTSDLGLVERFPMRQIRTSMDVDCPRWLDFFHGGLQFQVIHHLFPRLPRHNLRAAQPMVIDFCEKVGLKYSIYGFKKGNEVVLSKLEEVANQARVMVECAKTL